MSARVVVGFAPIVVVVAAGAVGVVVVGAGCNQPPPGCGERQFFVDADACAVDGAVGEEQGCDIDFGTVPFGLSETRRLSWAGACSGQEVFDTPHLNANSDIFRVGQSQLFIGDRGDEGFVFVSATPTDDAVHEDALIAETSNGVVTFPLVVNR